VIVSESAAIRCDQVGWHRKILECPHPAENFRRDVIIFLAPTPPSLFHRGLFVQQQQGPNVHRVSQ
jgi:hypothetical protein